MAGSQHGAVRFLPALCPGPGGIAIEPWHLSHRAESQPMAKLLTCGALAECLQQSAIAGKACILTLLPALWQRYIAPTLSQ